MISRQFAAARQAWGDWSIRLGIAVIVSVLMALLGPFGTYQDLSLAERLLYWGGLVFGSLGPAILLRQGVRRLSAASALRTDIASAVVMALGIGPAVWAVNAFGMRFDVAHLSDLVEHVGVVLLFCLLPVLIRYHLRRTGARAVVATTLPVLAEPSGSPAFLRRLDADKRGTLLHVSADGHQLSVSTSAGESRVRMRFSDALEELAAFEGVRVHRSHWVALSAISAVVQDGRRCRMEMTCGKQIPVSEIGIEALRAAGFRPIV